MDDIIYQIHFMAKSQLYTSRQSTFWENKIQIPKQKEIVLAAARILFFQKGYLFLQ